MTRVTDRSGTPKVSREYPIRALYGIAIRDDLARFRSEIGTTASNIRDALKAGDPKAPAIAGDFRLTGKEYKYAQKALKEVEQALKALKSAPSTPPRRTSTTASVFDPAGGRTGGGMIAMYGIAIRDDLARFRSDLNRNVAELTRAIAAGKKTGPAIRGNNRLEGKELEYAKKALAELQAAQKALKSVPSTW